MTKHKCVCIYCQTQHTYICVLSFVFTYTTGMFRTEITKCRNLIANFLQSISDQLKWIELPLLSIFLDFKIWVEKPEGKKLQSISYLFFFFGSWTRHKSVCRRRYSCAEDPKDALLYNIAALSQADQFSPVIVKGTANQEVPVVTATVVLFILVWSLCFVNASLFAFYVKQASSCNLWVFGEKLRGK
jgi:hypothetical protein